MYNKIMKPSDALNLLDKACASISTNRETHIEIQKAVDVLKKYIETKGETIKLKGENKK